MGIQERKQREREQRRTAIINTAMRIFLKKGLADTTMEEIAAKAEYSKATLYLYFKNKEELLSVTIILVLKQFIAVLEEHQSRAGNLEKRIKSIGEAYLDFYDRFPGHFKLLNSMNPIEDFDFSKNEGCLELIAMNRQVWEVVCRPIVEAIRSGILESDTDPLEIGVMLWTGSTGILNLHSHLKHSGPHRVELPEEHRNSELSRISQLDYHKMVLHLGDAVISSVRKTGFRGWGR